MTAYLQGFHCDAVVLLKKIKIKFFFAVVVCYLWRVNEDSNKVHKKPSKCHIHTLKQLCTISRTGVHFCFEHAVFSLK